MRWWSFWVSIHAFRGEGDYTERDCGAGRSVSIHAFRGEGDTFDTVKRHIESVVSIHAFRGEGDRHLALIVVQ